MIVIFNRSIINKHLNTVIELTQIVMGSIEENRYQYSINTQIPFQKSPSRTSHPQIIHIFQLSDFEFFRFLQHLPPIQGYLFPF